MKLELIFGSNRRSVCNIPYVLRQVSPTSSSSSSSSNNNNNKKSNDSYYYQRLLLTTWFLTLSPPCEIHGFLDGEICVSLQRHAILWVMKAKFSSVQILENYFGWKSCVRGEHRACVQVPGMLTSDAHQGGHV